jgi:hypothetical protein
LFPPDFDGCCALQCGPVVCIVNSRWCCRKYAQWLWSAPLRMVSYHL